ncbi:alpha/beta fold hydrolase [Alteromonas lipolytica]|uniref:AB hydrolase-1 domain-containing protein n=1 Tax=Alteromonas lipolytica TaxID=1856405 RepID=A0A1E8FD01_9ALTE|nr:alpha/beta fold hydrolase [Alteromonas lipolytica]OFI33468.1 hypothetical protein BFC17_04200 [Alteromonas lipolytica]GGF59420.1 hypothetical protein GCM10011338_09600 [Alteromonas lipolytica]
MTYLKFVVVAFSALVIFLAQPLRAEQLFVNFSSCQLASGESIPPCKIGYRTFGRLNEDKSNAVLVPTWYGGNSKGHAYLADSEYLDPDKYYVIIIDAIGNGVSVSPSNSPSQPAASFPVFTITDMVNSQYRLLTDTLGIKQLYAIVGLSMGAMQTLQWAVSYPDFTTRYAAIIGSPRLPSFDIARWSTRNRLLKWYLECRCQAPLEIMTGMQMLNSVPTALSESLPRDEVESTIVKKAQGIRLTEGQVWDQIRQAQAMITHNIADPFNNDMAAAAKAIRGKLLVVVGADDRVVTPQPVKDLAGLTRATLVELDKDCGHGDPWCDAGRFSAALTGFLAD